MKMFMVQYVEVPGDGTWIDGVREDLIDHGGERVSALFYTVEEATAYITAMCGLIHCGGDYNHFRIVNVVDDGEGLTYGDVVVEAVG